MRLVARLIGTWLLALALILLVVDGARWLASNQIVLTSLADTWSQINSESLAAVRTFFQTRFFGAVLTPVSDALLDAPGWIVLGIPGLLLAWAGRTRRARLFVRHDQI
jgi:hypothetical protein